MESRLKERLTGAAILVALIVLIVPEIFHDRRSAPTPPGITTGTQTGASTVPTRSYTIELARPPAAAAQSGANAQPVAGPKPAVEAATPDVSAKTRVASAAGRHGRGGGWTVQLGLFAKSANAERLAHTAHSHGVDVAISRFGPRGLYRVAVAGIADRAAAEQLSHRLHDAGLPAAILGPR